MTTTCMRSFLQGLLFLPIHIVASQCRSIISNEKAYQHLLWRINTGHIFLRIIYSWLDLSHWPIKTTSPGLRKMEFNHTINEVWTSSIMSNCVINAEGPATNSFLLYEFDMFRQIKYCCKVTTIRYTDCFINMFFYRKCNAYTDLIRIIMHVNRLTTPYCGVTKYVNVRLKSAGAIFKYLNAANWTNFIWSMI